MATIIVKEWSMNHSDVVYTTVNTTPRLSVETWAGKYNGEWVKRQLEYEAQEKGVSIEEHEIVVVPSYRIRVFMRLQQAKTLNQRINARWFQNYRWHMNRQSLPKYMRNDRSRFSWFGLLEGPKLPKIEL